MLPLPGDDAPPPAPRPADVQKNHEARQKLLGQQNENEMVMKELEILEDEAAVYKQVGPILVRQDLVEARSNVGNRLDFIKKEISRTDASLKTLQVRGAAPPLPAPATPVAAGDPDRWPLPRATPSAGEAEGEGDGDRQDREKARGAAGRRGQEGRWRGRGPVTRCGGLKECPACRVRGLCRPRQP